jgi:hypothetical protein
LVLYGCGTWYVTLREEHRLTLFENRSLRRIFGPNWDEMIETGENCVILSFVVCVPGKILLE